MTVSANKKTAPTRDAGATKNRILDAAEEEFAKGGLLGARTESIAANTGVTKAMLYYYFGDKEGLYQAVLERAFARRLEALGKVDIHSTEPRVALNDLCSAFIDEAGKNKNLPAIFFYEGIQNQGRFYAQISIASLYTPLVDVLNRGIASGQFRQLDSLHAAVNIIGMCVYYFCSAQNIRHLWPAGSDLYGLEMRTQHKLEAIEQIIFGVLKSST
jgi:TetR/AcrR family transcriptional regulator